MKKYFTYNDIHNTVESLADQIEKSGFKPDLMVAIGTGGFIPARMLKTYINIPILTVGIAYYDLDHNTMDSPIITQWLDNPDTQIKGRNILLVDEVDDTRTTIAFCLEELYKHQPGEIAVAVLHNKSKKKNREYPPQLKHAFNGINIDDHWICYPWDAVDIEEHDSLV